MNKTKILWSGITGRTGVQAEIASKTCECAEIVAGICRCNEKYYNYNQLEEINEDFDVIVDFSHKDCFDKVLDFAIKKNKVLVSGTSGITEDQLQKLEKASHIIPIFRGGNFRFDVENFINDVVEYAKSFNGKLKLVETHYKTKKIPSETAKVVAKRVLDNTGKIVEIESRLEYDELINDWKVDDIHCRVQGFEQLGKDVLKIANMMKDKKPNGLYDLNRLLSDDMTDKEYMQIAIDISKKAKYPYGAIVVKDNKIIGRSDSEKVKIDTCYTHAEFVAIQDALKDNNLYGELKGATMYVSCEPCPMCMGAILYEEFDKLVYGAKLEDSHKHYCPEVLVSCEDVAKNTKNRNIKIINLMRDEAVEVLKNAGKE